MKGWPHRMFDMLWDGRSHAASQRFFEAAERADEEQTNLQRVSLDVINESVGPHVKPYSRDNISAAVDDVIRHYRKVHHRGP